MTQVCNPETGSWLTCPQHRLTCAALAAFQGHEAGPGRAPSASAGHSSQRLQASSSDSCSCYELGGRAPKSPGRGGGAVVLDTVALGPPGPVVCGRPPSQANPSSDTCWPADLPVCTLAPKPHFLVLPLFFLN